MTDQDKSITQIPDDIPEDIRIILEGCENKKAVLQTLSILESFTGPIPHPKILKEYTDVFPEAPERIFAMAESQQSHRMNLEKSVINGDIKRADTGLILGFVLFLMFGAGSILLLSIGKDMQGYALLGTSLIGGIGNFIRVGQERIKATKDSEKKSTKEIKPTSKKDIKKTK